MGQRKVEFEKAVKFNKQVRELTLFLEKRDFAGLLSSTQLTSWFAVEWLELLIDFAEYEWSRDPRLRAHSIVREFFELDKSDTLFMKEHYKIMIRQGGYACPPTRKQLLFLARIGAFKLSRRKS
jgi:hypothetical protein